MNSEHWLNGCFHMTGDIALDVGANHGQYASFLAPGYRQVIAIEPQPLPELLALAARTSNITVHSIGAWSRSEKRHFVTGPTDQHFTTMMTNSTKIEIECKRLDDLPIVGKVDFLKIDVEGAEVEVLKGAANLITSHHPWIVMELHSVDLWIEACRLLLDFGYIFTTIRHPNHPPHSIHWHNHSWLVASTPLRYAINPYSVPPLSEAPASPE